MVTRSELSSIGDDDLQGFKNSVNIPPEKLDTNFAQIKAKYNTLQTFVKDETVSKDEQNEYGARQDFNSGIRTSRIDADTDGEDITIAEEGSGRVKIEKADETVEIVATETHVAEQIAAAATVTGVVATPATDVSNSTAGAVPSEVIANRFLPYRAIGFSTGWQLKTTNFTIENGGKYIVGSSVTAITLPDNPSVNYEFQLVAGSGTALSAVTLTQAASGEYINGENGNLTLDGAASYYSGICVNTGGSATGWRVSSSSSTLLTVNPSTISGRLTLESGVPISTTDQTAKTTVYFTPYKGATIALYGSGMWSTLSFTETSLTVPSTTDTNFDIFAYDNSGTLALEAVDWTNDTTRATALVLQDGIKVKTGETAKRYLGTGRTTGVSGQTQFTESSKLLWNYYNRLPVFLVADNKTGTWSYTTAAYRAAGGDTDVGDTRVELVSGVDDLLTSAKVLATFRSGGTDSEANVGVGVNATNANVSQIRNEHNARQSGGDDQFLITCEYKGYLAAGYSYLQWLEYGDGTHASIFIGVDANTQSGLIAEVMM